MLPRDRFLALATPPDYDPAAEAGYERLTLPAVPVVTGEIVTPTPLPAVPATTPAPAGMPGGTLPAVYAPGGHVTINVVAGNVNDHHTRTRYAGLANQPAALTAASRPEPATAAPRPSLMFALLRAMFLTWPGLACTGGLGLWFWLFVLH